MRHSAGTWSGKTSEVPAFRTGVQKETASRFDVGTANKSRTVIWRGLEFA